MVSEFRCSKQITALEDAHGGGDRNGVEVLNLELSDTIALVVKSSLEDISILSLQKEEEHGLLAMGGSRDYEDTALSGEVSSPGNDCTDIRMALVLVDDKILRTDKDARGPITAPRDGDEEVGTVVNRLGPLAGDMVETEIKLVEGEVLLGISGGLAGVVLVGLGVVELNGRKDGVVEAAVHAGDGIGDCMGLVSLERGGNGEAGGGITVEDVDELLLLAGGDHDGSALGIDGEVLAGDNAAAAGLAEGLLVDLVEAVLVLLVLEDDDAAGVGADDDVVLLGSGEAELGKGSDGAEDIDGVEGLDLAGIVGAEEVECLATGDDDLLGFAAGEVAIDGADNSRRLLKGQVVKVHGCLLCCRLQSKVVIC